MKQVWQPRMLVQLTDEDLDRFIQASVRAGIASSPPPRITLKRKDAAAVLSVSETTLDRLVRTQGLPFVMQGDTRYFRYEALVAWALAREQTEMAE